MYHISLWNIRVIMNYRAIVKYGKRTLWLLMHWRYARRNWCHVMQRYCHISQGLNVSTHLHVSPRLHISTVAQTKVVTANLNTPKLHSIKHAETSWILISNTCDIEVDYLVLCSNFLLNNRGTLFRSELIYSMKWNVTYVSVTVGALLYIIKLYFNVLTLCFLEI